MPKIHIIGALRKSELMHLSPDIQSNLTDVHSRLSCSAADAALSLERMTPAQRSNIGLIIIGEDLPLIGSNQLNGTSGNGDDATAKALKLELAKVSSDKNLQWFTERLSKLDWEGTKPKIITLLADRNHAKSQNLEHPIHIQDHEEIKGEMDAILIEKGIISAFRIQHPEMDTFFSSIDSGEDVPISVFFQATAKAFRGGAIELAKKTYTAPSLFKNYFNGTVIPTKTAIKRR